MEITLRILCLLVGYLLGSFLTAECIARRLTGRSARDLGSGNPGMANIMATLGKGPGFAVLAGDVAKTVLACGLCWLLAGPVLGHTALLYAGRGPSQATTTACGIRDGAARAWPLPVPG